MRTIHADMDAARAVPGARRWFCAGVAGMTVLLLASAPIQADALRTPLLRAANIAADRDSRMAAEERALLEDAGLVLGVWHRIGPFRHQWEAQVDSELNHVFPAEADFLANHGAPDLTKTYDPGVMPGDPAEQRAWLEQPQLRDGFFNELPRGPAPSWNETQYLYRTITVDKPVRARSNIYVPGFVFSHSRMLGAKHKAWLNGHSIGAGNGHLNLREGANYLVIKISNSCHQYGFAFGLRGLHGERAPARNAALQSRSMLPSGGNYQTRPLRERERPFVRASDQERPADEPRTLVRKDNWIASVIATRERMAGEANGFRPLAIRLEQDMPPREVRVSVEGLKTLWLTTESHHATPAWVEPVWIRSDGGRQAIGPSQIAYPRHGLDNERLVIGAGTTIRIAHADVAAADLTLLEESRFELDWLNFRDASRITVADRAVIAGSGETGIRLLDQETVFNQLGGEVTVARLTVNGTYQLHGGTLRVDRDLSISTSEGFIDFSSGGDGRLMLNTRMDLAREDRLRHAIEQGRFTRNGGSTRWEDFVIEELEVDGNTYRMVSVRREPLRAHPRDAFHRPPPSPIHFAGEPVAFVLKLSGNSRSAFEVPSDAVAFEARVGLDAGSADGTATFSLLEDPDREPGAAVWTAVREVFPDDTYMIDHERQAGIWEGYFSVSDPETMLAARYRESVRELAAMDAAAFAEAVPKGTPVPLLSALRTNLVRYMEAHDRLREVRFEMEPEPYYATGLQMEEALARLPESLGAARYKARLAALRAKVEPLLREIKASGEPRFEEVLAMERGLDAMWREEMERLPPIVYVHRPGYSINATGQNEVGFIAGCSIRVWDPARSDEPPRVVYEDSDMGIHDFEASFDAQTVFFSGYRRGSGRAESWQIYEVGIDGSGFRRITDGKFRNISPAELPNGRIMFLTDRMGGYAMCQGPQGRPILASIARDGTDIQIHSANVDSDNAPVVMDDGRVLFTRWDYGVDKDVWIRHGLWTMNPDGTDFELYFGNTIIDPNGWWRGRQIPGRPEVVSVFGAHHREHSGMIGITWPGNGKEAPRGTGYRWITRDMLEVGDDGIWWNWQNPYPLNEQQFLVSGGLHNEDRQVQLYLLDRQGNWRPLFAPDDGKGVFFPQPVVARARPPVIPERSNNPTWTFEDPEQRFMRTWDPGMDPARMLVQDVYQGIESVVARGRIKHLAVMEQLPKTDNGNGWSWNYGPVVSKGAMHRKRVVGLVPVEEDGSAYFEMPPLRSIYFNLLDEEGRTLMKMSADMHAQPGEMRSCVGCHEYRHGPVSPPVTAGMPRAARKPPARPVQPDWGTEGLVHYPVTVQPVFDRNCVECHSGASPAAHLDLSGDKTRYFNMSYDQLTERFLVDFRMTDRRTDMDVNSPLNQGAIISKIRPYLEDPEHSGNTLTRDELLRVYAWIDSEVVYYATNRYSTWEDADGRRRVRGNGNRDSWYGMEENHPALETIQQIYRANCADCHTEKWGHQTRFGNEQIGFGREAGPGRELGIGGARNLNLSNPEWSPLLQAPLAAAAGGWGLCETPDGREVFADKNDSRYRAFLQSAQTLHENLYAHPRMDMRAISDWLNAAYPADGP